MKRIIQIVFCILALCLTERQLLAQIKIKQILLNSNYIAINRNYKYTSSSPYLVETAIDTSIVKIQLNVTSKVNVVEDTIRYSDYIPALWSDTRGNREGLSIFLNSKERIVDSLHFNSNIVTFLYPDNPNYCNYREQGLKLTNVPYITSATLDTIYFRIQGGELKSALSNIVENKDNRTRFTQSTYYTISVVDIPDTAYISLVLIGSFPLDVKQTVMNNDIRFDMQTKQIKIPNTFYSDKISCYNILGKECRLMEVGGQGFEKHFSFAQLSDGMYFIKIANKTYKILVSK